MEGILVPEWPQGAEAQAPLNTGTTTGKKAILWGLLSQYSFIMSLSQKPSLISSGDKTAIRSSVLLQ